MRVIESKINEAQKALNDTVKSQKELKRMKVQRAKETFNTEIKNARFDCKNNCQRAESEIINSLISKII